MIPDQRLLEQVVELCHRAGEAILEVYRRDDFGLTRKPDDSPLTAADLAANEILTSGLRRLLDLPVLSEESAIPPYSVRRCWPCYWLIDPLDGTREFVSRNGEFTVNVALVDEGRPVLGVVYVPVTSVTYTGTLGAAGAVASKRERGQMRIIRTRALEPGQMAVVALSRNHKSEAVVQLTERLESRFGALEVRRVGSSLKSCLVAEGAVDLYPRLGSTCEWDTAAAQAVVEAAGGAVTDTRLLPLLYNQKESLINPAFYVYGDQSYNWRPLLSIA